MSVLQELITVGKYAPTLLEALLAVVELDIPSTPISNVQVGNHCIVLTTTQLWIIVFFNDLVLFLSSVQHEPLLTGYVKLILI